jgi:hypothetical protein
MRIYILLNKSRHATTGGIRISGQHGAQGPRMPIAKSEVIPDHEIYKPRFRQEPEAIDCNRCTFGTGFHGCWRGEYLK